MTINKFKFFFLNFLWTEFSGLIEIYLKTILKYMYIENYI